MSAPADPTGPRTTPDGASDVTEIVNLPAQTQQDTLPHNILDIKKGAKTKDCLEDRMGSRKDIYQPTTITGRPSRKLRN